MLDGFVLGLLAGGILKIYTDKINKKRHVIDKEKVRRLCKLDIKKIPCVDVREKYEEELQNFINVIKKEIPYVDLSIYDRNIKELIINEKNLPNDKPANYDIENIIVRLLHDVDKNYLSHELFHLATSLFSGGISYSGFYQYSNDFSIGCYLNEGYTSLLDDRYFVVKENCYIIPKRLASAIEKIVGQRRMTELYFKADLQGLIKELSNYGIENHIYLMIEDIDCIYKYDYELNKRELSLDEKKQLQYRCYEVTSILFECYIKKMKDELENNIISKDEFAENMKEFVNILAIGCRNGDFEYSLLDEKLHYKIMEENFTDINTDMVAHKK